MNKKILIYVLISLVLLSGALDLISTFFPFNFTALESNPVFIFMDNLFIMVVLKIGILIWVCFESSRVIKYQRFYQYFWIYFAVMLIFAQGYASYNNFQVKEEITKELGYKSAYDVPVSAIEEYKGTNTQHLWKYLSIVFLIAYLPAFMALSSFKLWEMICCDDSDAKVTVKLYR